MPDRRRTTTSVAGNRRAAGATASRRSILLEVNARQSTARRIRRRRISRRVMWLAVWCCVATGFGFSVQAVLEKFFFSNPDYRLVEIELDTGDGLTREEALLLTGLRTGINLFRIDLGVAETRLETVPEIVRARVRRELPGTLRISADFRQPAAWVTGGNEEQHGPPHLLVDTTGHVYQPRRVLPDQFLLPVISGVRLDKVAAGDPLARQDLREALALLQTVRFTPESTLDPRAVDVSKGYCLLVQDASGAEIWFAAGDYPPQLARLQKLLDHCIETGRELEMVNLIPRRNTPVRFALASARRAEAVEPDEP